MEAYRDQYATLFNNGKKVVVLGVSVDPDTMLANWARESSSPRTDPYNLPITWPESLA